MTDKKIILETIVTINDIESIITSREFSEISIDEMTGIHKQLRTVKGHILEKVKKEETIKSIDGQFCPYCQSVEVYPFGNDEIAMMAGRGGTCSTYMGCASCGESWINKEEVVS